MRVFVLFLLWFALGPAMASEPVFRIKVFMTGQSGGPSFSSTLEIGYAPCAIWTGGSGGWKGSPAGYLDEAGGLGGIRPGMSLPFFASSYSGDARGSDGSSAQVITLGPGFARWTERSGSNESRKETDASLNPSHHQSARFYRTPTGARIADFTLGLVSAGAGSYIGCVHPEQMEIDGMEVAKFCSFEVTNEELANWKSVNKVKSATFKDANGSVTVVLTLSADIEDPGEVTLEPLDYENWIPKGNDRDAAKPGNSLRVKVRVHPTGQPDKPSDRKAKMTFFLEDVTKEPGVCLNFPKGLSDDDDLRFLADENPNLQVESSTKAVTREKVNKAEVVITSFDFASYGRLRVLAEDDKGRALKVRYKGKENVKLAIPKDDLGGRIADAWRIAEGAQGLALDWDEAQISGQTAKGDGMTLLQKYRGLIVRVAGANKHQRMKAKEKVHFVIDEAGAFDPTAWRKATGGIRAYLVDETYTEARRVDFNSDKPGNNGLGKCAVRIEVMSGVVESDTQPEDDGKVIPAYEERQYAYTMGFTPATNERLRIFPDRIRAMLSRVKRAVRKELTNPETEEELEHAAWLATLGTKEQLLKLLDNADLAARTQAMMTLTATHEMGHVCSTSDHLDAKGVVDDGAGNPDCPMYYLTWKDRRRFLLFGELTGRGMFCSGTKDECFKRLNVKG